MAAASPCLLLRNMFDPAKYVAPAGWVAQPPVRMQAQANPHFFFFFCATRETEPNWDVDLRDEVVEECCKYGTIYHIFVDKTSPVRCFSLEGTCPPAAPTPRPLLTLPLLFFFLFVPSL